jgi:hypothetical protein
MKNQSLKMAGLVMLLFGFLLLVFLIMFGGGGDAVKFGALISVGCMVGSIFLFFHKPIVVARNPFAINMTKDELQRLVPTHKQSSFESRPSKDEGWTKFKVHAAMAEPINTARPFLLGVGMTFLIWFIGFATVGHGETLPALPAMGGLILGFLAGWGMYQIDSMLVGDKREAAYDSTFNVHPLCVQLLHPFLWTVNPQEIDRLRIRNSLTGEQFESRSVVMGGGGNPIAGGILGEAIAGSRTMPGVSGVAIGGAAGVMAAGVGLAAMGAGALGNAVRKGDHRRHMKLAANSFVLEAHIGGQVRVMAGGMDENTAYGLMQAVIRAIGGQS